MFSWNIQTPQFFAIKPFFVQKLTFANITLVTLNPCLMTIFTCYFAAAKNAVKWTKNMIFFWCFVRVDKKYDLFFCICILRKKLEVILHCQIETETGSAVRHAHWPLGSNLSGINLTNWQVCQYGCHFGNLFWYTLMLFMP